MANPNNVNGNSTGQQVVAQFGFPSSEQILPNSIDSTTGSASLSSAGDSMAGTFADPNGIVGGLYNDIMGFTSQNREFAQQMKMTEYENKWNSAQQQMSRAKEAGINPLTAAAGISGGGTGQVATAGAASPTGLSDLGSAVSGIGKLPGENAANFARAGLDRVNAGLAPGLADASIFKDAADAAKALVGVGAPEIAAMELGLSFARNGLNGFSNAFNADGMCRRFDLENDALDAQINELNAKFADTMAHVGVNYSEAELNKMRSEHESIINQIESKRLALVNQYQELAMNDGCLTEWAFMRKYGVDSPEVKGYMDFLTNKFYSQSYGQYSAEVNTIFDKAYNDALAKQSVKNDSAEFESMIRQNEEWIKGFINFVLNSSESNPVGLISRALNILQGISSGAFNYQEDMTFGLDRNLRFNNKPDVKPRVIDNVGHHPAF